MTGSRRVILAALCLVLSLSQAWAHRIDEYLQATVVALSPGTAAASMRLIPGVRVAPAVIAAIDTNRDGAFSDAEKRAYVERVLGDLAIVVDGQPQRPVLETWSVPDPAQLRDGLGEIHIAYRVDLPPDTARQHTLLLTDRHVPAASVFLVNAEVPEDSRLQILGQQRNREQSVYELDYSLEGGQAASRPSSDSLAQRWRTRLGELPFANLFHLGLRHIAEGTDHLLFLLVLLLPAPLLAERKRWGRPASVKRSLLHMLGIVTAFTVGHSLTLTLAAMGLVRVPGRPVEVLIAVSILISAVHALRPLLPNREAWIAGFFGLIHGLAFASTLDRLGLAGWQRLGGILAFNLGIEAMQLLVVLLVLPSLLMLSRTRLYPVFRVTGAALACAASLLWIAERTLSWQTPVDEIVDAAARRGLLLAALLFLLSLASYLWMKAQPERASGL